MENIGASKMLNELKCLNPEIEFEMKDYCYPVLIFGTVPADKLVLPDGYYYNDKNGITNKHNTESGIYETFTYEFDVHHFRSQIEPKQTFWLRFFKR